MCFMYYQRSYLNIFTELNKFYSSFLLVQVNLYLYILHTHTHNTCIDIGSECIKINIYTLISYIITITMKKRIKNSHLHSLSYSRN